MSTKKPRTICARAGEPLTRLDRSNGHVWCQDCRDVEPELYQELTGKKPQSPGPNPFLGMAIVELRASGHSYNQIAAALDTTRNTVCVYLNKHPELLDA